MKHEVAVDIDGLREERGWLLIDTSIGELRIRSEPDLFDAIVSALREGRPVVTLTLTDGATVTTEPPLDDDEGARGDTIFVEAGEAR